MANGVTEWDGWNTLAKWAGIVVIVSIAAFSGYTALGERIAKMEASNELTALWYGRMIDGINDRITTNTVQIDKMDNKLDLIIQRQMITQQLVEEVR